MDTRPAALPDPPSPREAVSLDDLNAAAAARERDDADWCTRALLHRPSPPAPAPAPSPSVRPPSAGPPPPSAAASETS